MRDPLGLHAGDELLFRVEGPRAVVAKTHDFISMAGGVAVPASKRGTPWDDVLRETRRAREARPLTAFVDRDKVTGSGARRTLLAIGWSCGQKMAYCGASGRSGVLKSSAISPRWKSSPIWWISAHSGDSGRSA